MPTIINVKGFRFFFYSNDHDPLHIHIEKDSKTAKFSLAPIELYNNSENQLKATIRNLLIESITLKYSEPYITIGTTIKSSNVKWRPSDVVKTNNKLLVYPNPSRDCFILAFSKQKYLL